MGRLSFNLGNGKTGASNTTIVVTGYTGPIHSFGSADTINVTELA